MVLFVALFTSAGSIADENRFISCSDCSTLDDYTAEAWDHIVMNPVDTWYVYDQYDVTYIVSGAMLDRIVVVRFYTHVEVVGDIPGWGPIYMRWPVLDAEEPIFVTPEASKELLAQSALLAYMKLEEDTVITIDYPGLSRFGNPESNFDILIWANGNPTVTLRNVGGAAAGIGGAKLLNKVLADSLNMWQKIAVFLGGQAASTIKSYLKIVDNDGNYAYYFTTGLSTYQLKEIVVVDADGTVTSVLRPEELETLAPIDENIQQYLDSLGGAGTGGGGGGGAHGDWQIDWPSLPAPGFPEWDCVDYFDQTANSVVVECRPG